VDGVSAAARPDVIVCGAGTAGAVVAGRLAEAGARVLVLEAGPDHGPFAAGRWPADLLAAASLPGGHDWGYDGPGADGQPLTFGRARVVGGCSAHNGCAQTCGWAGDYDRLAADLHAREWAAEQLRPLFRGAAQRLRIRRYGEDEVQPFQRAFLDAAAVSGIPETSDLDDLDGGLGCGCEAVNIVDGVRWNSAFAYLDPVRESANLELRGGVPVDRVIVEGGRAVGVRALVDGRPEHLPAGAVVVCGGTYGSPELLLRSGIGPADELRAVGVAPVLDLPGVGRNLHDQPAVQLEFAASPELAADLDRFQAEHWLPEEQAIAKLASPAADGPYDVHVYPWTEPRGDQTSGWRCVIPAAALTPRSRGALRLRSPDPDVRARLDHRFLSDPGQLDLGALVHGVRWILETLAGTALGDYCGQPLATPPDPGDQRSLERWIRATHRHYWHPCGTCRMGLAGDPGAVVDARGRVHGVQNLVVADASVLPSAPRSTTALPVVVAAERIASAFARPQHAAAGHSAT
jgi:choline dehydrogenase-like flavoprotein